MKHINIAAAILLSAPLALLPLAACRDNAQQHGTRLVLEADVGRLGRLTLREALDGAKKIIERRADDFGIVGADVSRDGAHLNVFLPGVEPHEALDKIAPTALLHFCQPLEDDDGNFAVVEGGKALYKPYSCEPQRNEAGSILAEPGATISFLPQVALYDPQNPDARRTNDIVWTPAKADLRGAETELTGRFLEGNTFVRANPGTGRPELVFNLNPDGSHLFEQITERLTGMPLTFFLDEGPIRGADGHIIAPTVQSVISNQGQITGLSLEDAQTLSTLLNAGAFPTPLRVVEQYETGER